MRTISEAEFRAELKHGRTGTHPEHWPADVQTISMEGLSYLGLDSKGNLYLDGHRVHTERRLATQERIIAWLVAASTVIGSVATAYEAFFKAASH